MALVSDSAPAEIGSSQLKHAESVAEQRELTHAAWERKNILCFDGGGIRGLFSLLVINALMEWAALIEQKKHKDHSGHDIKCSSFSPIQFPKQLVREASALSIDEQPCTEIPPAKRFLPVHYVDLIGGSSTGALIAILLGRLRMTVPDCIEEYQTLGSKVFGRPRHFTELNFGLLPITRNKFNTARFEAVVKDVVNRRSERSSTDDTTGSQYPLRDYMCRTFVTAFRHDAGPQHFGETDYLFRTYTHAPKRSPGNAAEGGNIRQLNPTSRTGTQFSANTAGSTMGRHHLYKHKGSFNSGEPMNTGISDVARAATAAMHYFEPKRIQLGRPTQEFTDGALGPMNNPTPIAVDEIIDWTGDERFVGIVISIGTSRPHASPSRRILSNVRKWIDRAGDTEPPHIDVQKWCELRGKPYFRFNSPGSLDIDFDEWHPTTKIARKNSGTKTIGKIKKAFYAWASDPAVAESMRQCAELLVECRLQRTGDLAAWEAYCCGQSFQCRECSAKFFNHDFFERHLHEAHHWDEKRIEEKKKQNQRWRYPSNPEPGPR